MTPRADAAARRRLFFPRRSPEPSPVAPALHAVRIHDRWVLLDSKAGEYLSLHDPAGALRLDRDGRFEAGSGELREALRSAGLMGRRVGCADPTETLVTAASACVGGRPSAGEMAKFAAALLITAIDLARPFPRLIRPLEGRLAAGGERAAVRHAAMFTHMLVWSPWQGECLFRSRWLLRYLQMQGCRAEWVFGVRGWPLRAHCWVQRGAWLLNETPDAVLAYRVLAVF